MTATAIHRFAPRSVSLGIAAITLGALASPTAVAAPPGCSAADMAGVAAGVAASTSGYLFAHPDVNEFYTGLPNRPDTEVPDAVHSYFESNPQTHTDLLSLRQPLVDFRSRCGLPDPGQPLLDQ